MSSSQFGGKAAPKPKVYPDARPGDQITLKNGAVAQVQPNGQLKIVSGASKEYLDSIRSRPRREITPRAAKAAYTRYYNSRNYKTEAARKAAKTRDNNYKSPVRTTSTYLHNPGKYDYPGVDLGEKSFPKATGARAAALARGRSMSKSPHRGPRDAPWWKRKSA